MGETDQVDWRILALDIIDDLCRERQLFTSDDVWDRLMKTEAAGDFDPRRLGPLMQAAQRQGLCRATSGFMLSRRRARHSGPVRVWESTPGEA